MKYNPLEILLGLLILILVSYILLSGLTYLYIRLTGTRKKKSLKWLWLLVVASVGWVAATLLAFLITSSFGLIVFGAVSFVLIFGILYLFNRRLLLLEGNHKIIYPLTLAVAVNPVWLFAFKLL